MLTHWSILTQLLSAPAEQNLCPNLGTPDSFPSSLISQPSANPLPSFASSYIQNLATSHHFHPCNPDQATSLVHQDCCNHLLTCSLLLPSLQPSLLHSVSPSTSRWHLLEAGQFWPLHKPDRGFPGGSE